MGRGKRAKVGSDVPYMQFSLNSCLFCLVFNEGLVDFDPCVLVREWEFEDDVLGLGERYTVHGRKRFTGCEDGLDLMFEAGGGGGVISISLVLILIPYLPHC